MTQIFGGMENPDATPRHERFVGPVCVCSVALSPAPPAAVLLLFSRLSQQANGGYLQVPKELAAGHLSLSSTLCAPLRPSFPKTGLDTPTHVSTANSGAPR